MARSGCSASLLLLVVLIGPSNSKLVAGKQPPDGETPRRQVRPAERQGSAHAPGSGAVCQARGGQLKPLGSTAGRKDAGLPPPPSRSTETLPRAAGLPSRPVRSALPSRRVPGSPGAARPALPASATQAHLHDGLADLPQPIRLLLVVHGRRRFQSTRLSPRQDPR